MQPYVTRSTRRHEAGFSLTELMIASTAFVVILGAAMSMMVQWQRVNGRSEADITAINQAAKAIGQIADDVRMATYIYHYATISISQSGVTEFRARANPETFRNIGIVTQGEQADGLANSYFTNRGVPASMMGVQSTGTSSILALITDQPYGLSRPRYILYWIGPSSGQLRSRGNDGDLNVHPLYRLEASPSVDASPRSWYSFGSPIAQSCATSGFQINLSNTTSTIQDVWSSPLNTANYPTVNITYKMNKLADIVMGEGIDGPFTLRNEHPFSNRSLLSPYSALITLTTSRVGNNGSVRDGSLDIYTLSTSAYARNIPLPQQRQGN